MRLQIPQVEIDDTLPLSEQVRQIKLYLMDATEKLEWMLREIDTDNLSQNLLNKLGGEGDISSSPASTINLGGYLKKTEAANTYLTQTDAANTYLTQSDAYNDYVPRQDYNNFVVNILLLYNGLNDRVTALEQRT